MNNIKEHFNSESKEYDEIILKLIPYYKEMVKALVDSIPYNTDSKIKIIDLGCGTGTISELISKKFPNAQIICLDIAKKMIEMAKLKLSSYNNIEYVVGDFYQMSNISNEFDVVVSSLALHHLETDSDKINFYQTIYNNLKSGGVFFNADVVLGSNDYLQNKNMSRWIEFMNKSVSLKEIQDKWIPTYKSEDRPTQLIKQLKWLEKIGFQSVDIIWKYYNFSVYGGSKH
ncbi:methyltransferase domain-containing protein [Tamlana sp. 2201CG12-4]|uniref:class I SAM-dependent methyltransferase n=1 Tax=Tamlana sp. 2201CG12-4 TaxID=3112582 RepID=UPI002DB9ACA3|nr:methyltransferase domain-containing protein [Tamlana sp. 2201CG12-4]MEC3908824.1 methyltransferase domain-containing protein [Tamlana sp. 2201CG12-4]